MMVTDKEDKENTLLGFTALYMQYTFCRKESMLFIKTTL